ncbi:MAG TPA: hypothetical protein VK957_01785 [Lunatimonas sp.]|nr:hypothetical protein [Lunatimonas sp.]
MNNITKALVLSFFIMISIQLSAQESPNKLEVGFNLSQYQKDFGFGLHVISPYFIKEKVAIKAGVNLQHLENLNGTETTWTSYQNIQLGIRSRSVIISERVFIYGEAGVVTILPNNEFSSESSVVGGYGLFGFEFRPAQRFSYFIEMGAIGSGATADKLEAKPIYSNGLVTNVGFRVGL